MELTQADFTAFYPQFTAFTPGVVLSEFLCQANARFSDFAEDTAEARRLYTAHKLTLYAAACLPENTAPTKALLADAGSGIRTRIASRKVGEVSVTYSDTSSRKSVSGGLQDLAETTYGLQLLSLLRLHGFAKYLP